MKEWELKILLSSDKPRYEDVGELDEGAVLYLSKLIDSNRDALKVAKGVIAASNDRGRFRSLCEAFVLAAATSKETTVRLAAADAARNLTSDSKDKVLAILKDDPDPRVQQTAAISSKASLRL